VHAQALFRELASCSLSPVTRKEISKERERRKRGLRAEFLLKTNSGYPRDEGDFFSCTMQTLGDSFALTPIGEFHSNMLLCDANRFLQIAMCYGLQHPNCVKRTSASGYTVTLPCAHQHARSANYIVIKSHFPVVSYQTTTRRSLGSL